MSSKTKLISFDFWQKLGKALLVVIAVMPAAGLMVSIGKLIGMSSDAHLIMTTAKVVEDIGWGIIGNLHILFAVAIGGSWAKERAGGAFAAVIAFILINRITGVVLGVNAEMLLDPQATVTSLTGSTLLVKDYFTSILGAPALNMGVFVGIISGFMGAVLYNKFYNFDKLPKALAFFNGKRFVPFVVILGSVIAAIILSIIWPFAQGALNAFGMWIASSKDTAPVLAPFVYGTLERLLLPFGLHHMITVPMNYTELGGIYHIATGAAAGTTVAGQDPLWLAWITDLINFKSAGDMASYKELLTSITPARFKAGQVILSTASLAGISLAMYKNVDKDKAKNYKPIFISAMLACFLTGVTEPIEFMFMFISPVLYIVYAILTGLAFALADIIHLRVHAFGFIEFLTRTPMLVKAGLTMDLVNFFISCAVFFLLNFGIFNFLIKKFNIATPGRKGNYIEESNEEESKKTDTNNIAQDVLSSKIINLLGGADNIEDVDACMTRLRVTVKDVSLVGSEKDWKALGALGLIVKDRGVQAIYGPKADVLKSNILDMLGV
ncbi:PTS transporter subunit IIBC [Paraclostridium bifermentans]|uniref:PTS transporter subunit IIBC n=2 Tax=Paraclostridium TaxID=1849822 RepID=UPI00038D5923|nr:PTS transporter subunit IIBC [Paraclostridium bifermentans]EQK47013.1 PTS system, glucose-like IIB component domain protein [[Clostridium] bifermentans ATCC 19299] [Paraclostridium bifermentans ATCC 19299]MCE9674747.1 PTS transporter subunit IIBC [Paraclostridium bifermentans]TQO57812.1 PTS transporter subunit IICB [Paraclostridium bifermentans]GKZ03795.1 PTS trehalose transporter subunit IIBC [Paraclostridium bifermentans]GKZ05291.1 PTS trehalose transporter subunit IIBC [Paraclostridium b